ncbi:MAG: type II secretion system F family protein [Bdellovibrionales bacterium]|nr:type II secretion system F family protein [Bdellovibrionales bacterium]
MSITLIAVIIGIIVVAIVVLLVLVTTGAGGAVPGSQNAAVSNNLRTLVLAQRERTATAARGGQVASDKANLALAAAAEGDINRKKVVASSRLTLEKQLRYARWPITPAQFRGIQVLASLVLLIPAYLQFTVFIQLVSIIMGQAIVKAVLERAVNKRFEAFDKDYPVLLLQYVSLLKTGMSAIQGLEAAAKGLDPDSLVRAEVELLIERLRLGLTEEQAISAFGEDIAHPELELFVQSLILSKRVGGTLSHTLERLAKQVRKRQQFRKQAVAAVGMERSSLYMIAVIMGLLMLYLGWSAPELVFPAFDHPLGKKIFQFGVMVIIFGFYWSSKVTNIKI